MSRAHGFAGAPGTRVYTMRYALLFSLACVAVALLLVFGTAPAAAQDVSGKGPGKGGGDGICDGPLNYDPSTVATFTGTLADFGGLYTGSKADNPVGNGLHFLFETTDGTELRVVFGPFWFLDDNGIALEEGMQLTLTGSVIPCQEDCTQDIDTLIVASIEVDGVTLVLRGDDGTPVWPGDACGTYYACPQYQRNRVQAEVCTVLSVRVRTNAPNADAGLELMVRTTDRERLRVYLGPHYYAEHLGFAVKKGEQVRLRGSVQNREMVCREVKTADGKVWRFRANNGDPLWMK